MAATLRRPSRRSPRAQEREVGAAEINIAAEFRARAGLQIAFSAQTAGPREAEVEFEMQRRASRSGQGHARVRQGLRAEDNWRGGDVSVDRHRVLPGLKRRYGARQEHQRPRRRDSVLGLAAQERVDVGLFGFQRDAEPSGRAEDERRLAIRSYCPLLRSKAEFRAADRRLAEIGGHPSGDAPWRRQILAGAGSRQRDGADEAKALNPSGRVAFERAVELGGGPIRAGVHLGPERRPVRTGLFRREPEDDGSVVWAGELAAQMGGPVWRRHGRIDLDAVNLRCR